MPHIIPIPALKDNYIWMLINSDNQHVAIVDPSEAQPVIDYMNQENLTPVAILITHHHWDHVGGIPDLVANYSVPVYTPATETVKFSTNLVTEGDKIELTELDIVLNVLDVPGHTAGAVAYYNEELVFSGDTLFTAGCGRMFEGTPKQMHHSLTKFKSLPDNTLLYCGHEYTEANLSFAGTVEPSNPDIQARLHEVQKLRKSGKPTIPSTLALEKKTNPFLRCEVDSVVQSASTHSGQTLTDSTQVFAAIRQWKDDF